MTMFLVGMLLKAIAAVTFFVWSLHARIMKVANINLKINVFIILVVYFAFQVYSYSHKI